MKILLDAQLPRSLARPLRDQGFDTLHTFDLPDGNRSSDAMLSASADRDGRVVFSKDADFIQSHFLRESPLKLLVIATGNIRAPRIISKSQRLCRHEKAAKEAAEKENTISTIGKIS